MTHVSVIAEERRDAAIQAGLLRFARNDEGVQHDRHLPELGHDLRLGVVCRDHRRRILVIALPLLLAVAMIIYAERKIWAAIALRRGPNVVRPWGLLQSFADGLKVFLKETIIPTSANKTLFLIAPIITFTVALIVWAVVPFDVGVVLTSTSMSACSTSSRRAASASTA